MGEKIIMDLAKNLPGPIKTILRPIYYLIYKPNKHHSELSFWKSRLELDDGKFKNSHYRKLMLAIADEIDETFLAGKTIADFGCGPRGSLVWASQASVKIGIDVLADAYAENFKNNIISHGMIYVKSTEEVIPLPSNYIDILFTLNAMDHVDNFEETCKEVIRIIRPGGELIASFNINEHPTSCEPQMLTEELIKENLLNYLGIKSYRISNSRPEDLYGPMLEGNISYKKEEPGIIWVRATKPNSETQENSIRKENDL